MHGSPTAAHALRALTTVAVLAALVGTSVAQSGRPITHEDVWTFRRLGAATLDPTGTFAILPVTEPSYDKDGTRTDLWWVPLDGSKRARRLTDTAANESAPTISPDGNWLAFTAKRDDDDKLQLYLLPLTGPGEARRLTQLSTGVSGPVWSPDSSAIAFTSTVLRGVGDDEAQQAEAKKRADDEVDVSAYEGFPIRSWDRWIDLDDQTRPFVLAIDTAGQAVDAPRDILAGTDLAASSGLRNTGAPVWTPDGQHLVLTAVTNAREGAFATTPSALYVVPAAGGEPDRLTPDGASWSNPRFSPDGSTLFCSRTEENDWVYNLSRVARADLGTDELGALALGPFGLVAEGFDRPVSEHVPVSADRTFVVATEHGRRPLFELTDARARPLDDAARGVHGSPAATHDGKTLVTVYEDSAHPSELVATDTASGATRVLTDFNASRSKGIHLPPFEELWFTSSEGRRIHCWVAIPPGMDDGARLPILAMMHGGPHSSSLDKGHPRWDMRLLAAPGFVVVAPDYTGSVGYGEDFARAIQGDPLTTPCLEIVEAIDAAIEHYGDRVDPDRVGALGASYGGHMANWLQARHGDRFRCLVGHAGLASLEGQWGTSDAIHHRERNLGGPPWAGNPTWDDQSPHTYADRFSTPMLLTIGEKDYRVPLNQTLHMWAMLQRQQVPSRLLVYHSANHWIMRGPDARHFWGEVHDWLRRWLQP